jgi:hypothetical protein
VGFKIDVGYYIPPVSNIAKFYPFWISDRASAMG